MKQQPTKDQIAEYLISNIIDNLVSYVMEDEGIGIEESLDKVYGSEVIKKLQDKDTELYVQSPAYVYEMMNSSFIKMLGGRYGITANDPLQNYSSYVKIT